MAQPEPGRRPHPEVAQRLSTAAGIAVTIGFLGAYTTFSTFGYETVSLARDGRWSAAAAYVGASMTLGLGAAALGCWLGRSVAS